MDFNISTLAALEKSSSMDLHEPSPTPDRDGHVIDPPSPTPDRDGHVIAQPSPTPDCDGHVIAQPSSTPDCDGHVIAPPSPKADRDGHVIAQPSSKPDHDGHVIAQPPTPDRDGLVIAQPSPTPDHDGHVIPQFSPTPDCDDHVIAPPSPTPDRDGYVTAPPLPPPSTQTESQNEIHPDSTLNLITKYPRSPLKTKINLNKIKLPPKMLKRGRPKGAGQTVVGIPKKKKKIVPCAFIDKSLSEKQALILSWIMTDVDPKVSTGDVKINSTNFTLARNLLDDEVQIKLVKPLFPLGNILKRNWSR